MRRYENPRRTHENRLPTRSWYLPRGAAKCIPLNGEWDFAFFENGDAEGEPRWGRITVPSCWQLQGYEHPNYSNVNYPFPVDMPLVPDLNPMGLYRRVFAWEDAENDLTLVLEGASSEAEVTLNGREVGFTQGSHLFAEFDLTPFARRGENTLEIRVRKWCCGSYLEDQDQFRYNGLFRDVYLLSRPKGHLFDLEIRAEGERILCRADGAFTARVYDGETLLDEASGSGEAALSVPSPRLWTAETPNLYTVTVEAAGEIITQKVGFRTVEIAPDLALLVNGAPVKLRGVNHHDTHPEKGWTMSREDIERDLRLMKRLHINAIRTSHYPPCPYLLELCDELGFYVILETDIETHGFVRRFANVDYLSDYQLDSPEWPCGNPDWEAEFVDRMRRAYERDKNHPSIVMWSVGNECSFGENHRQMIRYLKSRDPRALIHSENASRFGLMNETDVYSRMYPSAAEILEWAKDPEMTQPVFLCEYAHAMGNGPGGIADYVDAFYSSPKLVGGCIWEWADHVVLENGVQKYGGDFPGEKVQDGNFCCDGMVFSDRSLKPGSLEIRAAYAPVAIRWENGRLAVKNHYDHLSFSHLTFAYRVRRDGETLVSGEAKSDARPGEEFFITPASPLPDSARYGLFMDLTARDENGEEIAALQAEIPVRRLQPEAGKPLTLREEAFSFVAEGRGFRWVLSKQTGFFTSAQKNGEDLLAAPAGLTYFRPLTDNDRRKMKPLWDRSTVWQGENVDCVFHKVYGFEQKDNRVTFTLSASGVGRAPFFRFSLNYEFFADGSVKVSLSGRVREDAAWLPRLGFEFRLPYEKSRFTYFGNGPTESYRDMALHGAVDRYSSDADAEYVPYVRPQEHGNHFDCRALEIDSSLSFEAEDRMEICVLHHSTEGLEKAAHTDEIPPSPFTHVRVDYKDSGIGSGSCGPELDGIYRLSEKEIRFAFRVKA